MPSRRPKREGSRTRRAIEKGAMRGQVTKTIKFQRIIKNHQREAMEITVKILVEKIGPRDQEETSHQEEMSLQEKMSHQEKMNHPEGKSLQEEIKKNLKEGPMKAILASQTLSIEREIKRMSIKRMSVKFAKTKKKVTGQDPETSIAPVETTIEERTTRTATTKTEDLLPPILNQESN